MKKAYLVRNYKSSWGIQNRIDALVDWAVSDTVPFEIDVVGDSALVVINDDKKASYESEYKWDRDIQSLKNIISDLQDPMFANDGQDFRSIDFESMTPEQKSSFTDVANICTSSLGREMLKQLGLEGIKMIDEEVDTEPNGVSRVQELEAMAANINLTEGLESLTPEQPIEEYSREKDEMITSESEPEEPKVEETTEVTPEHVAETQPVPPVTATDLIPSEKEKAKDDFIEELMEACSKYELTPTGLVAVLMSIKALANKSADVSEISTESLSADEYKTLKGRQYPNNFMKQGITTTKQAKKLYKDINKLNAGLGIDLGEKNIELVNKEKALYVGDMYGSSAFLLPDGKIGFIDNEVDAGSFHKKSTIEKDIETIKTSTDDVTGTEDYSYQDAVPYVKDPHEPDTNLEIPVQHLNMPDTGRAKALAGISSLESINPVDNEPNEPKEEPVEDVYASLVNDTPETFSMEWFSHGIGEIEFTEVSCEALFSKDKSKNDNQVIQDINKVLADIKVIAKKAWEELKERNQALIEKYGAFIKLLLDIKDFVFMDNRQINLNVASFNIKKANNEIVPDTTEETIMKAIGNTLSSSVFGPFASAAKGSDKPGKLMIAVANELRSAIIKHLKSQDLKGMKPAIELQEDELSGVYTLVVSYKNLPQQKVSAESLIDQLVAESKDDAEFFEKILEHKADIDYSVAMECVNNDMYRFYKTGEKVPQDRAVSSKRIIAYIKK